MRLNPFWRCQPSILNRLRKDIGASWEILIQNLKCHWGRLIHQATAQRVSMIRLKLYQSCCSQSSSITIEAKKTLTHLERCISKQTLTILKTHSHSLKYIRKQKVDIKMYFTEWMKYLSRRTSTFHHHSTHLRQEKVSRNLSQRNKWAKQNTVRGQNQTKTIEVPPKSCINRVLTLRI